MDTLLQKTLEHLNPVCNTFEFHRINPEMSDVTQGILRTGLSESDFDRCLVYAKGHLSGKPSYKTFKCYRIGSKVMENTGHSNEDVRIHAFHIVTAEVLSDTWVFTSCIKHKLAYHTFPCTPQLHDMCHVERLIYRLHNRVFLNFEKQTPEEQRTLLPPIFKIYINYNHDPSVELSSIVQSIKKGLQVLASGSIS